MKRERKRFFFEKKKQKTFDLGPEVLGRLDAKLTKVFLVLFFQKKNYFLSGIPYVH
jgi:hypothetical protein